MSSAPKLLSSVAQLGEFALARQSAIPGCKEESSPPELSEGQRIAEWWKLCSPKLYSACLSWHSKDRAGPQQKTPFLCKAESRAWGEVFSPIPIPIARVF